MYKVYKITNNLDGSIYVGYTKQSLSRRFYGHWYELRNTIISRTIRKYGKDNFCIELLEEYENEYDAKCREVELIALFKTNVLRYPDSNGMNMTDGGEGAYGYKHSTELREKWKRERKGKKPSAYVVQARIEAMQSPVFQFTTEGTFVARYNSTKEAAAAVGCDASNISRCCTNKTRITKGYIFQYTDVFQPRYITTNKKSNYTVQQFSTDGELMGEFDSVNVASTQTGIDRGNIHTCICGRSKTAGNFVWKKIPC